MIYTSDRWVNAVYNALIQQNIFGDIKFTDLSPLLNLVEGNHKNLLKN